MSRKGTAKVDNIPYERTFDTLVRPIPPGGTPSHNAHITVPHPDEGLRSKGWRQEWVILSALAKFTIFIIATRALCYLSSVMAEMLKRGMA